MEADPAEPGSGDPEESPGPTSVAEQVTASINEMLRELPPLSLFPCIYRVPHSVRIVNPQCYTPRLVSIGPLHRDNPRLKPMEQLKLRFYRNFLARISRLEGGQLSMAEMVESTEDVIRGHYQDEIKLKSADFCKMILLDSVFIVELLLRKRANDPMLKNHWFFRDLLNDILLIENQIPLFVAECFYQWYYLEDPDYNNFPDLVRGFIKDAKSVLESLPLVPNFQVPTWGQRHFVEYLLLAHICKDQEDIFQLDHSTLNPEHPSFDLEDLLLANHEDPSPLNPEDSTLNFEDLSQSNPEDYLLSNFEGRKSNQIDSSPTDPEDLSTLKPEDLSQLNTEDHLLSNPEYPPPPLPKMKRENWKSGAFTASRLRAYGVRFEEGKTTVLVNIEFKKKEGTLIIPRIKVNEWTENLFRNLVAFEHCHHIIPRYASDYLIFMDGLIDTPEDVNILTGAGIIQDDLQDPEKVSDIFNNLYKEVITDDRDFLFDQQSRELNDYRRDLLHRWIATWYTYKFALMMKYFASPWSFVSFSAAVVLLGLTIIQTICAIYQAKGKIM